MKVLRHGLGGQNRHVFRQPRVECRHQPPRGDPPIGVEVRDLTFRVGAGVGSPGGVDREILAGDLPQRPLQLGFHCPAIRLLLPAGEIGAVVLQHDFDIHFLTCSPFMGKSGRRPGWGPSPNQLVR